MITEKTIRERGFNSYEEYKKDKQERDKLRYHSDPEYREKLLERRRKYLETHRELVKAKQRTEEYRAYHRRQMAEAYAKNRDKFLSLNHVNYRKNKPKVLRERMRKADEAKAECVKYLGGKCEICGYDDHIAALQFHHMDPSKKEFILTKKFCNGHGLDKIQEEVDKCCLLCANCHAIVTHLQVRENHERILKENAHG